MSFILHKAFSMLIMCMRGFVFTTLVTCGVLVLGFMPETSLARESDQAENANCVCKSQRRLVRPMTESMPIRKKDKDRVRRILM